MAGKHRSITDSILWYCPKCDRQTSQTAAPNRTEWNHENQEVFLVRKCECHRSEVRTVEITSDAYLSFVTAIKELYSRLDQLTNKVKVMTESSGNVSELFHEAIQAKKLLESKKDIFESAAKRWHDYGNS